MTYEEALLAGDARKLYTARQIADLQAHDTLAQVATFMRTAGQQVKASPGQPTPEVLKLRLALELEELYEKAQAFGLEGTFQNLMLDRCDADLDNNSMLTSNEEDTGIYDAVEVLDAAVDQRYVQDGTVLACGLQAAFPEAFANVQASNLSKFPGNYDAAERTVDKYTADGVAVTAKYAGSLGAQGPWVVRRASDQKVLKSVDYIPASLGPILEKHSGK